MSRKQIKDQLAELGIRVNLNRSGTTLGQLQKKLRRAQRSSLAPLFSSDSVNPDVAAEADYLDDLYYEPSADVVAEADDLLDGIILTPGHYKIKFQVTIIHRDPNDKTTVIGHSKRTVAVDEKIGHRSALSDVVNRLAEEWLHKKFLFDVTC